MTGAEPRISVVVPVFNNDRYLGETLRRVLDQTAGDFEVVVCDQASTDTSAEVSASFRDPRIRIVTNAETKGAVPNWNRGMAEARGRYVKLLCADDLLYPACLERQAAVLDDPANAGVSLVTAVHDVIDEEGKRIMARGFRKPGRMAGREAIRRVARSGSNLVGEPSGTMFRAEAYRAAGLWSESARYVVDLDMWVRLLLVGDLFVLGETLSAFRVQRGSWSNALTHTQTADMRRLLDRMAADPAYGVSRADAALGAVGAWRDTQLRRLFYRVFLRGADLSRLGD
ncbi:MAG TPA: glycosyltransferase [Coriobacteriia bacterium]